MCAYRCRDDQLVFGRGGGDFSEGRLVRGSSHSAWTLSRRQPFAVDVRPSAERRNCENDGQLHHNYHLLEEYVGGS